MLKREALSQIVSAQNNRASTQSKALDDPRTCKSERLLCRSRIQSRLGQSEIRTIGRSANETNVRMLASLYYWNSVSTVSEATSNARSSSEIRSALVSLFVVDWEGITHEATV